MRKHSRISMSSRIFYEKVKNRKIVVFGAGNAGLNFVESLQFNIINEICFFIDNDAEKQKSGVKLNGKYFKVYSLSEAVKKLSKEMIIIITSVLYEKEIYNELLAYGVLNTLILPNDINNIDVIESDEKGLQNDLIIKIFICNPLFSSNFGDALNETLIPKLFHHNIKRSNEFECNFISIGSVLEFFLKKTHHRDSSNPITVWGSGFIAPPLNSDEKFWRNMKFSAVRGYLTKERIYKITKEPNHSNLVVGDPGLLVSRCFTNNITPKYKYGLIPHVVDFYSSYIDGILKKYGDEIILIDFTEKTEDIIKKICSCEVIISSALHGLIVADSFGIPNLWVRLSDKIIGGDYKYLDYYSVFGLDKMISPFDLRRNSLPQDLRNYIKDNYLVLPKKVTEVQDNLYSAFHVPK